MTLFNSKRFICEGTHFNSLFGALYMAKLSDFKQPLIIDKLSNLKLRPNRYYLLFDSASGLYWAGGCSWAPYESEAEEASLTQIAAVLDDTQQNYRILPLPDKELIA